jgi:hypothetical protein
MNEKTKKDIEQLKIDFLSGKCDILFRQKVPNNEYQWSEWKSFAKVYRKRGSGVWPWEYPVSTEWERVD